MCLTDKGSITESFSFRIFYKSFNDNNKSLYFKEVTIMRIVKNRGQIAGLKGRYIFRRYDVDEGDYMYAKLGIMPVIGLILYKIKFRK